ncbi:transposase DDE domain protein [bacterium BMS3Abin15]|nr:transposase DDE domain protein [bacterium BMS3Abin15]
MGKRLVELGYISGDILNLDGHSIKLFSRKEMKKSYFTKDDSYGKAIRVFYTQDQDSGKPLFAKVAYSGTTVAQVTPHLAEANKEIVGGNFLCVCDKEWFIGDLLDQLDKVYGIQVLLPLKRTAKRLTEMQKISFEKFKYRHQNQPIAKLFTDLDGFKGPMRLFVKRNNDGSLFALITNKKYFRPARAMKTYSRRWGIENFFNENVFLGIDKLPSLEINAIQTALSLKMVSFNLVDNFRKNLPTPFSTMKPESIYKKFIQGVQGKVQIKRNKLQIDIYGFEHQQVVAPLLKNLEQNLITQNVDPRCSWLNNYPLNFSFK